MTQRPWCVLVNPTAGTGGASADELSAAFDLAGVPASIHTTQSIEHLGSVVQEQVGEGQRDFVAVGGDGTAHHLLNALMGPTGPSPGRRFALGMLAAGSGSDFVRTFGHRRNIEEGIARLADPDRYAIDIGLVMGTFGEVYFLNALNVGVAAQSARVAQRLPRRLGPVRYTAGFWLALARFPSAAVSVDVGRHRFEGDAITIVAANGQFFGGGMNIAPRATLNDGAFDVQVFQGPRRRAFVVMPRLVRGTHLTHTAVRRYIGGEVTITVPDDWPVETDGEILGAGSVTATTIRSALDFIA